WVCSDAKSACQQHRSIGKVQEDETWIFSGKVEMLVPFHFIGAMSRLFRANSKKPTPKRTPLPEYRERGAILVIAYEYLPPHYRNHHSHLAADRAGIQ